MEEEFKSIICGEALIPLLKMFPLCFEASGDPVIHTHREADTTLRKKLGAFPQATPRLKHVAAADLSL